MSLSHYFDCAAVLSRAEHNMLLVVEGQPTVQTSNYNPYSGQYQRVQAEPFQWSEIWPCFLLALQFDLQRVKGVCMQRLAKNCRRISKEQWESMRAQLDKDTLIEMLRASLNVVLDSPVA